MITKFLVVLLNMLYKPKLGFFLVISFPKRMHPKFSCATESSGLKTWLYIRTRAVLLQSKDSLLWSYLLNTQPLSEHTTPTLFAICRRSLERGLTNNFVFPRFASQRSPNKKARYYCLRLIDCSFNSTQDRAHKCT